MMRLHLLAAAALCVLAPQAAAQAVAADTGTSGPRLSALSVSFATDTSVR